MKRRGAMGLGFAIVIVVVICYLLHRGMKTEIGKEVRVILGEKDVK